MTSKYSAEETGSEHFPYRVFIGTEPIHFVRKEHADLVVFALNLVERWKKVRRTMKDLRDNLSWIIDEEPK